MGPRSSLDVLEERKLSFPRRYPRSSCSSHNLVAIPTEVFWLIFFGLLLWVTDVTCYDRHYKFCGEFGVLIKNSFWDL